VITEEFFIESAQNRNIKKIISLDSKKFRDQYGQFIVEGEKFVNSIPLNWEVDSYYMSEKYIGKKFESKRYSDVQTYIVTDSVFKKMSQTVNPQGILAICNKKQYSIDEIMKKETSCILVGENINDPGNLGTLIRTADATGCSLVLLTKSTVDVFNSKVIRATAGSIFNIPIINDLEIDDIFNLLEENNITSIGTHLKGDFNLYDADLSKRNAIIIGNESNGLTDKASNKSTILVKIPILGKAESLNASVASGVILYEVLRQKNYRGEI
jgi:RNA methyltransferase, TrmH family